MSALPSLLSLCRTVGPGTTLRKAAIHRDHQDRRRSLCFHCASPAAEPSSLPLSLTSLASPAWGAELARALAADMGDSRGTEPQITAFCSPPRLIPEFLQGVPEPGPRA